MGALEVLSAIPAQMQYSRGSRLITLCVTMLEEQTHSVISWIIPMNISSRHFLGQK